MTKKQEKIASTALRLFSEGGYHGTSTRMIAEKAGVSEGLIFRHFGSKEGLLDAIMQMGQENALRVYEHLWSIDNPKYALKSILRLPFTVSGQEHYFWRLHYSLKWKEDLYDDTLSVQLKKALIKIFEQLDYTQPEAEAELVQMMIDGAAMLVLLSKPKNLEDIEEVLMQKYDF